MKHKFSLQVWKIAYPYTVIMRIGVLVLASLVFLQIDQGVRNVLKGSKHSEKERVRYVERIH